MEPLPIPRRRKKSEIDPRWIVLGAVGVIILAVVLIYLTRDTSGDPSSQNTTTRQLATSFTLPGLNGQVSLSDFRGSYVLLNFWATWCPPCQAEMPDLNAYYQQHKNQNFVLLGIDVQEDMATVSAFLRSNGLDFPVVIDTTGVVSDRYGAEALPVSFLIGPDGTLVKTWKPGALSRQTMDRDITPLLKG